MKPLPEEVRKMIDSAPRWVDQIEHVDGNPNNNDLSNLRTVRVPVPCDFTPEEQAEGFYSSHDTEY